MKKTDAKELERRKSLTKYLRYGDQTEIAEAAGVSRQTVVNWLTGRYSDSHVGTYVEEFAARRKAEVESKIETAFK